MSVVPNIKIRAFGHSQQEKIQINQLRVTNEASILIPVHRIFRVISFRLSFLFNEGDKKRKKKSGSGSSTSSNSRSSTPTAAMDGTAHTIAAAVSKLSQERPGTPCK